MAAASTAATTSPTTPTGRNVTMYSPNTWSFGVPGGTDMTPTPLRAYNPTPMSRNRANWANTTNPLATSASRACPSDFAERYRWTMSWSAPCEAMVNTAPPITPAHNV